MDAFSKAADSMSGDTKQVAKLPIGDVIDIVSAAIVMCSKEPRVTAISKLTAINELLKSGDFSKEKLDEIAVVKVPHTAEQHGYTEMQLARLKDLSNDLYAQYTEDGEESYEVKVAMKKIVENFPTPPTNSFVYNTAKHTAFYCDNLVSFWKVTGSISAESFAWAKTERETILLRYVRNIFERGLILPSTVSSALVGFVQTARPGDSLEVMKDPGYGAINFKLTLDDIGYVNIYIDNEKMLSIETSLCKQIADSIREDRVMEWWEIDRYKSNLYTGLED